MIEEQNLIIRKHFEKYKGNSLAKSKILRNIGTHYMISGDKKSARKYFWESVNLAPYYFRNYVNLILSFLGVKIYKKIRKIKQER